MRNQERERKAKATAEHVLGTFDTLRSDEILNDFCDGIEVGVILGTGWGDVLEKEISCATRFSLEELPGFAFLGDLEKIEGHRRELVIGYLNCRKVALIRGRVHINESHMNEEIAKVVRLQIEMLIHLGAKHLILTNAAGSLRPRGFLDVLKNIFKPEVRVGDVVAHDGFVTLFAPPRPLWGGEFVSPEDVLKDKNIRKIEIAAKRAKLICHRGSGAMVRGPDFEGRKNDKRILREAGATVAMMSILPEVAVAALYPDVEVYDISFITNDDREKHSHEENQKRARSSADKLGDLLINLIDLL